MGTAEVLLLTSDWDGVSPSYLLSIKPLNSSISSQYLFNVPSAFSRLALEHRIRPGLGFKAILTTATDSHAQVPQTTI